VIWRLYCRIGDVQLGEIHADQRPQRGDLIGYSPPERTGFKGQFHWRIDEVVWQVAMPGSQWVTDRIKAGRYAETGRDGTVVETVDVLVWPERGPFWRDAPQWAQWFIEDEVVEDD
jgi:hypothetical protein